jgi:PIN domain nuclease of toxin-antitoxin system
MFNGMLNLDTHILLFALNDSLTASERKLLAGNPWGISAIVLWEVAKLAKMGRVAIDLESSEFSRIFARVHVWPLDLAVCRKSTELDFRSDPADELIGATSVVHRVPLLTRDRKLRKSKIVPIARLSAV